MSESALYAGLVTHHRVRPRDHRLAYRIYSLLLDLDELDALDRRLRLFSVDRFNLFSFHSRDRGDGSVRDLRAQVEDAMRGAGVEPDGGKILLLTMPRLLGSAFNPLSVFYCRRKSGELAAVLWEVDNTFGERHAYMIPVEGDGRGEIVQSCGKNFYVSPFMNMALDYRFRLRAPDDLLSLVIEVSDPSGLLLTARYQARREALSDFNLLRRFFATPLLTLRVLGGIHWEALKLWRKGIRLRPKPSPPKDRVTFVRAAPPVPGKPGMD
ncbi:DUF1365 family protein [Rhodoblastus acidophilus]|uniref:DUF1365 family protein n=1 Tax=Candidatus Rhodoblastus alkanivorans TaxID=2954117 RepID=A0ABS9Z7L5_9HYPH|nr:DUF1365 family protein [Candidatus Rhodoblastus alkanivorans]MCI4678355.1 DUF1365 family protein [Candidatus Rhodoblastus alkanivorans]MCI4683613.1 DUF1365 family protein [Candidatus Rhodoblastus alkanivorans]MDI4640929.1 DUF1365 family protein [Rhodoblastus acidophilus]